MNRDDSDASQKFREASEAYEVLADNAKRREYDAQGDSSGRGSYRDNMYDTGSYAAEEEYYDREEFKYKWMWERHSKPKRERPPRPITKHIDFADEVEMFLTFSQASKGVKIKLVISVYETCPKCYGAGIKPGTQPSNCFSCNGSGLKPSSRRRNSPPTECPYCLGSGKYTKFPCWECDGQGKFAQQMRITVPVEAGIQDGAVMEMKIRRQKMNIIFK